MDDPSPRTPSPRADGRVRDRCGNLVCPWCHRPTEPVAVHGHLQCACCGTNIDPCCDGETADGRGG